MALDLASWAALSPAEWCAYLRALSHAEYRKGFRCEDVYAKAFVKQPFLRSALLFPLPARVSLDATFPGCYAYVVARTLFLDRCLREHLAQGLEQLVLLGAGYDSRAYRFSIPYTFEVDRKDLLTDKRQTLHEVLGSLPEQVQYVPIDFQKDSIGKRLLGAGFDPKRRSLILWEGVSMYLDRDAVLRCLTELSGFSDCELIFDFVAHDLKRRKQSIYGVQIEIAHMRAPLSSWWERDVLCQEVKALGFDILDVIDAPRLSEKVFNNPLVSLWDHLSVMSLKARSSCSQG